MRRLLTAAILCGRMAYADDSLALRANDGSARDGSDTAVPLLVLDPMLMPVADTAFAATRDTTARWQLGAATQVDMASEIFDDATTDARGYTAGAQLSRRLRFARLVVGASASKVDSRFGSQLDLDIGVALVKTLWSSRWTTVWISLGIDYRRAAGVAPGGLVAGVSIGGTFR